MSISKMYNLITFIMSIQASKSITQIIYTYNAI